MNLEEKLILEYTKNNYPKILREPMGLLKYKFIVPGAVYKYSLWDWDSWLTDIALTQIAKNEGTLAEIMPYQMGCILNFVDHQDGKTGRIPICITDRSVRPAVSNEKKCNAAKPVIVQHALFIAKAHNRYKWLLPLYDNFRMFLDYYDKECKHESGLYFFVDDFAIGVDNDPCTFYRPDGSSASIYLNCLMYKELLAMAELAEILGVAGKGTEYTEKAAALKAAIREHCYDERNGFYYSADINLRPIDPKEGLHSGCPRHWSTLIQRIDVWSGMLAMWAGIASPDEAERMVRENYLNEKTFYAPFGIRTLSRSEKMYKIVKSGNPSCWLGPIWGVSNYFVYRALAKYGYTALADDLANKTITLFGKDIAQCGEMHEYYDPDTGIGVNNQGFQSWNLLAANIVIAQNGGRAVEEI